MREGIEGGIEGRNSIMMELNRWNTHRWNIIDGYTYMEYNIWTHRWNINRRKWIRWIR
jgi:hypothetical protein